MNPTYTVDLVSPAVDVASDIEERDIQLVEQTFAKVACLGADTVGKVIFTKFLAKQPTALQNFSFKDEPVDWAADRKATAHVTMVVKTVAIAVSLLRDLNTLVPVLQAIGTRHYELDKCKKNAEQYGFGLIPEHYGDFGGAVVESLAIALGPDFTEPAKNAWLKIYGTIVSVWNGAGKTGGTIRCDNYMNPTYTVDLHSPAVDVAAALDKRDIDLVQQSFGQVASLGADTVGKVVFMQIFKAAPGAIDLFSFKADGIEYAKLFRLNSPATKHATKVVTTVATAVSLLTDLDTLVPVLQGLGLKHGTLGIVAAHYDVVGEALIASLQIAFGANFTEPVKNSWLKVYGTIKKVMTEADASKADTSKADTSKKAK
jgi:methyl-accepting chemotaxis protein